MKTEVKKIDATKRQLSIEVSGDIVKNKFEEVFKKIAQEAKVAGFRVGHVPRDILEKNFSSAASDLVLKELLPDIYKKAVEKEALEVIDMPAISEVKLDRSMLSFKAEVEVSPEIKLKNYKGIRLGYKAIGVSPDEIKRSIDALKESRKIDELDDTFAKGLGYFGVPELEKSIEAELFTQKQSRERKAREDEVIKGLSKDLDFKLPQAMVNRQLEELIRQAKLDMALKGISREKIDEQEKRLAEELTPLARQQVKVYLVLSEIAKKENIPLDEHMSSKVMELLLKEADWKEAS